MKKILVVLCLLAPLPARPQLQTDTASQQLVLQSLDKIYNYEFAEVPPLLARLRAHYPTHPVVPLLQAVQVYWQYLPLTDHPAAAKQYTAALEECIRLGETLRETGKYDAEATFFLLAGHSYRAMQESDAGAFFNAVGEARRAYSYLKKGFNLVEQNPEFYFSTGLYQYYREQYPADHGAVKPLMLFFASGNKKLGLQQMDAGARRGTFTRTEATYYLVHVLLKHEAQPGQALVYSTALVQKFPKNPLFLSRHAEALVLTGRYAEAAPITERLLTLSGRVYPVAGAALSGLIQEKSAKNDKTAAAFYQKALKTTNPERYAQAYAALAYAGLGRIAHRANDRNLARDYFRRVLRIAENPALLAEARGYLKN